MPTHMLRICVNSPTTRVVVGADPYKIKTQSIANRQSKKYVLYSVSAQTKFTMPRLGDANTHAPHMC